MSSFTKLSLIFVSIPIAVVLLGGVVDGMEGMMEALAFGGFLIVGYFFAAIICFIAEKKVAGKALLLSSGILLLIGLSICGIMLSMVK